MDSFTFMDRLSPFCPEPRKFSETALMGCIFCPFVFLRARRGDCRPSFPLLELFICYGVVPFLSQLDSPTSFFMPGLFSPLLTTFFLFSLSTTPSKRFLRTFSFFYWPLWHLTPDFSYSVLAIEELDSPPSRAESNRI